MEIVSGGVLSVVVSFALLLETVAKFQLYLNHGWVPTILSTLHRSRLLCSRQLGILVYLTWELHESDDIVVKAPT